MSQHLIAEIKVEKIIKPDEGLSASSRHIPDASPRRRVGEVTRLVIRAKSMDELRTKVAGHLDLIDDEVAEFND